LVVNDVTLILSAIEQGDPAAAEQLLPLVYDELRRLAAQKLARETPGQTLQATALVHEAYLRLVDGAADLQWNGRAHFFGAAAEAMRRILIDNARSKKSEKHGGRLRRVNLDANDALAAAPPEDLLALDEALERLTHHDAGTAQLVKLHCFAGLSVEQAAEALGLSRTNGYRLWTFARAWLYSQLASGDGTGR
jgi:RNA polymerase sigma factor (TIGR02999 family)